MTAPKSISCHRVFCRWNSLRITIIVYYFYAFYILLHLMKRQNMWVFYTWWVISKTYSKNIYLAPTRLELFNFLSIAIVATRFGYHYNFTEQTWVENCVLRPVFFVKRVSLLIFLVFMRKIGLPEQTNWLYCMRVIFWNNLKIV